MAERNKRSPMSRISLHRPRHTRAVWLRPATDTRLLPSPFPPTIPHLNTHYKRCPKALRLRLRSDQSPSRPLHGRFPDKNRLALSKGQCQVRAPLTRRIRFASSGDALEHSVMSPPWAIAPCSDSPGLDLAGQSEQSDERRLKTNAPFLDSTVAALAGQSEQSDERRLKTNAPFTDSTVVTIGELRSTNAGHGSTLPSLRVVERFWWTRLPHREPIARLHHIFSEARGCRKAGFDVEHPLSRTTPIGTGVAAFLRNRPGPSIPSPSRFLRHSCGGRSQMRRGVNPSPEGQGSRSSGRTLPSPSLPLVHLPIRDDRPVAQGVDAPLGASTPLTPPTKGTAISHAHPFSIAGSPIPGRWRTIFPENNHTGTNFRLNQSKAPTRTTPSPPCDTSPLRPHPPQSKMQHAPLEHPPQED